MKMHSNWIILGLCLLICGCAKEQTPTQVNYAALCSSQSIFDLPKEFQDVLINGDVSHIPEIVYSVGMPDDLLREFTAEMIPKEKVRYLIHRVIRIGQFAGRELSDEELFDAGWKNGRRARFLVKPTHELNIMRFYSEGGPYESWFYLVATSDGIKIVGYSYTSEVANQ